MSVVYWMFVGVAFALIMTHFARIGWAVYREMRDSVIKQDPVDLFIEAFINGRH